MKRTVTPLITIATELALAVAQPYAGNIGGGGFMVHRESKRRSWYTDYREKHLGCSKDILDEQGNVIPGKSKPHWL
jgi:gamma-glutamyltranspeptidase/glutathione hydrolase